MPIQIREVVVRATLETSPEAPPAEFPRLDQQQEREQQTLELLEQWKEEVLAEAVERVLAELEWRRNR